MLKRLALTGLFALAAAIATAGTVAAQTGTAPGKKIESATQTRGLCPPGMPMCWPAA
jgi:hypothetical protein